MNLSILKQNIFLQSFIQCIKKVADYIIKWDLIIISILILSSSYLRFKNLNYSDYIGDEHKAFIELEAGQNLPDFLLSRRKGPMQFFVSYIPYLITHDFRNELAERIPFAVISVISVVVFYFMVKKITKCWLCAFLSSLIYLSNGFIVGFGRIVQYQNLNLLFSFLAIYFYSNLLDRKDKLLKLSMIGTMFWCLSFFSHWDAIFIIPVVLVIFIKFFLSKDISREYKLKILFYNLLLGCLILLPFMIPYSFYQRNSDENLGYLFRRLGTGNHNNSVYEMYIDLYGPFVTLWFLIICGTLGSLFIKKSYMVTFWFLFGYGIFELFVSKPGTHIYNFLIPVFILSGVGLGSLIKIMPKKTLKIITFIIVLIPIAFLYHQSYILFVDHSKEYPWEQKKILNIDLDCGNSSNWCNKVQPYLNLTTKRYYYDYKGQKLPLFGFPHKRYWNEVNEFIVNQNTLNSENLGYATNEDKTVSEWYIKGIYMTTGNFYFLGIRRPGNFVEDMSPPNKSETKVLVKEYKSENDSTVVKIYRVYLPKSKLL